MHKCGTIFCTNISTVNNAASSKTGLSFNNLKSELQNPKYRTKVHCWLIHDFRMTVILLTGKVYLNNGIVVIALSVPINLVIL